MIDRVASTRERVAGLLPAAGPRRIMLRRLAALSVVVALTALPLFGVGPFTIRVFTVAWMMAMLTIGCSISLGFAGIDNFSQASFFGIGAYVTAIALTSYQLPFVLAIVPGVIAAAVLGIIFGLVAVRVRGEYFGLVSLAFTSALSATFQNWSDVTGGLDGYRGIPDAMVLGIDLRNGTAAYYATLAVLGLILVLAWRFTHSFAGRALRASRYDEPAAASLGISVAYFKVLGVAFSAAAAGLAGSMLATVTGVVAPSSFDLFASFNIVIFAIVGGITSLVGGVVAAVGLTIVTELFRVLADYELLVLGVTLLVAIGFRSGILTSAAGIAWRRAAASLASRQQVGRE